MPDYTVTHFYRDVNDGVTVKQYEGTFADTATARTAANNLLIDAQGLTDAYIYRETFAEVTDVAGAPAATSNVFERISATVELDAFGKLANLQMPSPVDSVFNGNALNTSATAWTDFTANFSAGQWTISDGEPIVDTQRGKRIFVDSGRTNLPV